MFLYGLGFLLPNCPQVSKGEHKKNRARKSRSILSPENLNCAFLNTKPRYLLSSGKGGSSSGLRNGRKFGSVDAVAWL